MLQAKECKNVTVATVDIIEKLLDRLSGEGRFRPSLSNLTLKTITIDFAQDIVEMLRRS